MKIVKLAALALFAAMPSFAAGSGVCFVREDNSIADSVSMPKRICVSDVRVRNDGRKLLFRSDAVRGEFNLELANLKPHPQYDAMVLYKRIGSGVCREEGYAMLRVHFPAPQQFVVNPAEMAMYGEVSYTPDNCHSQTEKADVIYRLAK